MLLGELITLRQLHLPVKVVVFNNGALSFVELEMKATGFVSFGTDLENPDFAGIASAVGLHGATVERTDELEEALRAAFAHDGPALVEVRTARQELSLPPKITLAQAKGSPSTPPERFSPEGQTRFSSWPRRTCVSWARSELGAQQVRSDDGSDRHPELQGSTVKATSPNDLPRFSQTDRRTSRSRPDLGAGPAYRYGHQLSVGTQERSVRT